MCSQARRASRFATNMAISACESHVRFISAGIRFLVSTVCCGFFFCVLPAAPGQGIPAPLPTSDVALLGRFSRGPFNFPVRVDAAGFQDLFGSPAPSAWPAEVQAREFFANGGQVLDIVRLETSGSLAHAFLGSAPNLTGIYALEPLNDLQILIAPELSLLAPADFASVFAEIHAFVQRRRVFLILDPPPGLTNANSAIDWVQASIPSDARLCAVYFPYLQVVRDGVPLTVGACGAMAAVLVNADITQAIWSSPAGTDFLLQANGLQPALSSVELDSLNANHINAIRQFAGVGIVPWGLRSLDRINAENRYLNVVRTRNWIAKSIERWLAFTAVEDNDATLWTTVRNGVEGFLFSLYQQGAFEGFSSEAYFVRCDIETVSQADIQAHRINVFYGLALLRPREFDTTVLSPGTYDPARPVPRPRIHLNIFEGNLIMAYPTVPGFEYHLQGTATLAPGDWLPSGNLLRGNGTWQRPSVPLTALRAFYAVRVQPGR